MATAGALAMLMIGSVAARADVTDELLDQLKAKGVLTKAEYAKLKARHNAEVAAKPAPAAHGAPGTDRYITALDKGIGVRIPGKTLVTKEGVTSVGDVDVKLTGALVFFGAEEFKTNYNGSANYLGRYGVPNATGNPYSTYFYPNSTAYGPYAKPYGVLGGFGNAGYNNSNAIRAGLLPSNLVLSIATNQLGYDIGFTAGAYFGGNNVSQGCYANANCGGSPYGLGTPGIDLRQVFGTIGTPEWGTVKIGRDLGLFGGEAILNDFTLFGVGTPAGNAVPGNTSLGRIGLGYVYADWIPQIAYSTPTWNGFTATVAMMTPISAIDTIGSNSYFASTAAGTAGGTTITGLPAIGPFYSPYAGATSATLTGHDQPQFQGKLKYIGQFAPDTKVTAWVDGITQLQRAEYSDYVVSSYNSIYTTTVAGTTTVGAYNLATPGFNVRSSGVDGGARLDWGGFSAVGYGYWGSGLGTTGLFYNAFSPNGQARNSFGWYGEAEYTFWDRWTLGGSYGQSFLSANSFDWTQAYSPYLLKSNSSAIGFTRYKLTDWVAFQAEFINTKSINQSGGSATTNAFVAGTTFFF
jgi:hypothetical protein